MATNPMQRKSRNSFLLGMLLMLVITGIVIGIMAKMLIDVKKQEKEEQLMKAQVYILSQDVKSGEIITPNMLAIKDVTIDTVPANAISDLSEFVSYSLQDNNGNQVCADTDGLYIMQNQNKIRIIKENEKYYKQVNNQKVYIEIIDTPLIAKIDMKANTVVTSNLVAKSDEVISKDLRVQEYNMLSLPSKLNVGDYIDVRLTLSSGEDYIVISKKKVLDANETTIWLNLYEEEILTMSNAIVESYMMTNSKLYVNSYVEPGIQDVVAPTYAVSKEVLALIKNDPNIREKAESELFNRYTESQITQRNENINGELEKYDAETRKTNVETKMQQEIENRKELRKQYLEILSGTSTGV